ncbi:MAG: hypothetical protein JHC31_06340 [Sulfurihydrogenibium sp.]|jgi:hypothetical protein|nr:hypothetical protein [Sulfurihydrogenibium sp.]
MPIKLNAFLIDKLDDKIDLSEIGDIIPSYMLMGNENAFLLENKHSFLVFSLIDNFGILELNIDFIYTKTDFRGLGSMNKLILKLAEFIESQKPSLVCLKSEVVSEKSLAKINYFCSLLSEKNIEFTCLISKSEFF